MLNMKANSYNVYTKTQIQHLLLNLIDNAPASLDTLNELAAALADAATFATAFQTALRNRADISTTYTKTEADYSLSAKANQSTTYTKTEVKNALSAKAKQFTSYTKTEVNCALSAKSYQSTTYTKTGDLRIER